MLYMIDTMAARRKGPGKDLPKKGPAPASPAEARVYAIEIPSSVGKEIRDIQEPTRTRVLNAIDKLKTDPRPRWSDDGEGVKGAYRIDVRPYRILYRVYDDVVVVRVLRVQDLKEVYRKLDRVIDRMKRDRKA